MYYVTLYLNNSTKFLEGADSVDVLTEGSDEWNDYVMDMEDPEGLHTIIITRYGEEETAWYLYKIDDFKREYYKIER